MNAVSILKFEKDLFSAFQDLCPTNTYLNINESLLTIVQDFTLSYLACIHLTSRLLRFQNAIILHSAFSFAISPSIAYLLLIHSFHYRHQIWWQWSNEKENNRKNEIESRLKNNNYINSRNQTRPESGINSFSPKTNSFLGRTFYYYIFTSTQEGIRLWREGIYTGFLLGLISGINIIIIF